MNAQRGPELVVSDPWFEGLALVVNAAVVHGQPPGLLDAIRTGRRYVGDEVYVTVADETVDLTEARARWSDLDERGPVAVAGAFFLPAPTVLPWSELRRVTEDLVERRAGWHPPPPSQGRARIGELEELAAAVETRHARLADGDLEPPELVVLRQAVLRDLSHEGLLQPAARAELQAAGAGTLLDWHRAAGQAARYLASAGRRRYRPQAGPEPVWGSPVCLDLFRGGLVVPPTVDADEWASWGEVLLGNTPDLDAGDGEFLYHDADGWVRVRWRRDHPDVPALLGLALR